MTDWFWYTGRSEFVMYGIWGFYLALLTFAIGVSALLGLPKALALLAAAIIMLVAPLTLGWRIMRGWNKEVPRIVEVHPTRFLRKVRDLRYAGYVLQAIALGFLLVYLVGQPEVPSLLAQAPLPVAFVYFFIIELVLLQVTLNFWRPSPLVSLRACLLSEGDVEKAERESWLDDALDYFNQIKTKTFTLGIKEDLGLDALLLGSPSRRMYVSFLLRDVDSANYLAFVNDVSEIASKPISEVVGRVGIFESIRKNQWTILSIIIPMLVVLATNPAIIHALIDPIISAWSNLPKSVH